MGTSRIDALPRSVAGCVLRRLSTDDLRAFGIADPVSQELIGDIGLFVSEGNETITVSKAALVALIGKAV